MKFLAIASMIGAAAALPTFVSRAGAGGILGREWTVESLTEDIHTMGTAQIVEMEYSAPASVGDGDYRPVVQMHGMGDFANNPLGMKPMAKMISDELNGAHVLNVGFGSDIEDMLNGFLLPLEDSVDQFAAQVAADPEIAAAGSFNAIGYSQGNLIIRGYIERYNDPAVNNFVSVHGPLMGVAGIPKCNPSSFICKEINEFVQGIAYMDIAQNHITQANYLRDPLDLDSYKKSGHGLASWNLESTQFAPNATYAENLNKLNEVLLVRADGDTMVMPSYSEHFGFYEDGSNKKIWETMEDTPWYQDNTFGLKDLNEAGKIALNVTSGDHLQFSNDELMAWVDQYFKN